MTDAGGAAEDTEAGPPPADPCAGEPEVVDNPAASRYELRAGGLLVGELVYRPGGDGTRVLVHTGVDPACQGRGLGSALVRGALADLRARGLRALPRCPFVAAFFARHPEQADLLARPGD